MDFTKSKDLFKNPYIMGLATILFIFGYISNVILNEAAVDDLSSIFLLTLATWSLGYLMKSFISPSEKTFSGQQLLPILLWYITISLLVSFGIYLVKDYLRHAFLIIFLVNAFFGGLFFYSTFYRKGKGIRKD